MRTAGRNSVGPYVLSALQITSYPGRAKAIASYVKATRATGLRSALAPASSFSLRCSWAYSENSARSNPRLLRVLLQRANVSTCSPKSRFSRCFSLRRSFARVMRRAICMHHIASQKRSVPPRAIGPRPRSIDRSIDTTYARVIWARHSRASNYRSEG